MARKLRHEPGRDARDVPGLRTFCGEGQLSPPLTVTVVGPAPRFTAEFTPRTFRPGDRLTLTTAGCHMIPRVVDRDHVFATPLELHQIGATRHRGSAATTATLSPAKRYLVVVRCRTLGRVTFMLQPGRRPAAHPGGQTGGQTSVVPVGGVDTGDGSSLDSGGRPGGAAIAVALALALTAGLAGLGLTRRPAKIRGKIKGWREQRKS